MDSWYIVLIAALVALWIVICFFVIPLRLIYLRHVANDYSGYVCQQYTKNDKPTPAIIGRIQYENIKRYNEFRDRRYILKLLFKPLPIQGEESSGDDSFQRVRLMIYRYED